MVIDSAVSIYLKQITFNNSRIFGIVVTHVTVFLSVHCIRNLRVLIMATLAFKYTNSPMIGHVARLIHTLYFTYIAHISPSEGHLHVRVGLSV